MSFPSRTLLAFWLTLVATGTDVAHRCATWAGHTHGFGRASVSPACRDLPPSHHCLVLLGIEFDDGPDGPDETPDGPRPALGADALPAPDADPDADHPAGHLGHWLTPPAFGHTDALWSFDSNGSPCASPPAAPTRSSVLRL